MDMYGHVHAYIQKCTHTSIGNYKFLCATEMSLYHTFLHLAFILPIKLYANPCKSSSKYWWPS